MSRMERKKEERRNGILNITEKIIIQKGIQGMTMNEVAKEVDVATGTLYLYFKNKNSLCAAVNVRINRQMRMMVEEKIVGCKNACEKFKISINVGVYFRQKYPDRWLAFKELLYVQFQDTSDENIQELLIEEKNSYN